ncbi:MAG: cupredoxin domain-containing protein [Chloroflexota bacterium]
MNTYKQINIMIGLLLVGIIGTGLYYLFDNGDSVLGLDLGDRQTVALNRQELDNAERGAALFARYCRACHGLTGTGALERTGLPGAPLNVDTNRPPTLAASAVDARVSRLTDTIHCGRVGTVMPPWSIPEGGALNDYQIFQLTTLITSQFSPEAWQTVPENGNHTDAFTPAKFLARDVSKTDTTIELTDATTIAKDQILRIGNDTLEEPYELMRVSEINGNVLTVLRGPDVPFGEDTGPKLGSDPLDFTAGKQVYQGPQAPGTTLTGDPASAGDAPCGQKKAPAAGTPSASAAPVALTAGTEITIADNSFKVSNEQNPPLTVTADTAINATFTNTGTALHNFHIDGPDGKFDTDDDVAAAPDPIKGGATATVTVNLPAGTYKYQCDFHPTEMLGTVTVQ